MIRVINAIKDSANFDLSEFINKLENKNNKF